MLATASNSFTLIIWIPVSHGPGTNPEIYISIFLSRGLLVLRISTQYPPLTGDMGEAGEIWWVNELRCCTGEKRGEILGFTRYSLNVDEFKPQNSFWKSSFPSYCLSLRKNFAFLSIIWSSIYIFFNFRSKAPHTFQTLSIR